MLFLLMQPPYDMSVRCCSHDMSCVSAAAADVYQSIDQGAIISFFLLCATATRLSIYPSDQNI